MKPREAIPQSVSEAKDNFGTENAYTFRHVQHPDLRRALIETDLVDCMVAFPATDLRKT
jgi:hypothetical protein